MNTTKAIILTTLPEDILMQVAQSEWRTLKSEKQRILLPIVASIEQYSEIDEMTFEEAVGRLTAYEERLKSQDEPQEDYQSKLLMASASNQRL
ncbi:hypothetical protein Tco_0605253 [Tanacetum coccineum]